MTTIDPITATCPACLSQPGEPCIATSSDLPREHLHRLRGLKAAARLSRCTDCGGIGWEPFGRARQSPDLITCPVCAVRPFTECVEGGGVRPWHEVRVRAAHLGVGPCGTCDGIGWLPEGEQP